MKRLVVVNPGTSLSDDDSKKLITRIVERLRRGDDCCLIGKVINSNHQEYVKFIRLLAGSLSYLSNHWISKTREDSILEFLGRFSSDGNDGKREFTSDHARVVGIVHFNEPDIIKGFKLLGIEPEVETIDGITIYTGEWE